jgi:glycosyltransferase involved in cell wall biosynthesis
MIYDLGPTDDFAFHGGIESHIFSLLREFSNLGLKCHFITGSIPYTKNRLSMFGIEIKRINFPGLKQAWNPSNLNFKRQLFFLTGAILKSKSNLFKKSDLIHGHVYSSGIAGLITARINKKKVINTIHGSYFDHWFQIATREETAIAYRTLEKILSKGLSNSCDLQIHTDFYFANKVKSFGGASEKIITIHNGVDENLFHPNVEPSIKITKSIASKPRPILMTIRRLVPKNGIHDLIEACYFLVKKIEFTLVIGGEGPQRPALEALVNQYGLQNNIILLGRVPNTSVPKLLQLADLVIIPSLIEASSISLIEAMLMKKPSIATFTYGITEIADKTMVQFCKPSDPISLANGIIKMIDYPSLAKKKSEKAFNFAKKNLTLKKCAKEHLKAYDKLY